MSSTEVRAESS